MDAPARVQNYVEGGTTESDVRAIYNVATIRDGDTGDIAAL